MTVQSMSRIVLAHLQEIRQRLWNQDETFETVYLWPDTKPMISSTYIAMFLEETKIQRALQDCLKACAASPIVTVLHLGNLPEPDLEAALLTLAKHLGSGALNLRELYIGPLNASSSLSGKVLTKLLQNMAGSNLETLDCPCRIRVPNQAAVETLAATLCHLPRLAHLRLHVVPRTSIERPTVRLDALLRVACDLESLELIAGYPEHNPYQRSLVSSKSLAQLIRRNPAIRVLALANLGLQGRHVQALFRGPWPSLLEHLCLLYNPRLTNEWGTTMAEQLQDPQNTSLETVVVPRPCGAVDIWTTLNRLGRAKLIQSTQGSADHAQTWQDMMVRATQPEMKERLRVNLTWELIRQNPTLAVQSLSAAL